MSSVDNLFIQKLTQIIESNLQDEQFGVSELAQEMGMSRSNLHLKIKSATDLSASQYLRQYRLKRAREMLSQPDLNVSEVAYKVGFNSTSYFIKCFREYYGYPPGKTGDHEISEFEHTEKRQRNLKQKRYNILVFSLILTVISIFIIYEVFKPDNNFSVQEKSIVVIPFVDYSPEKGSDYIINGLTEEIRDRLNHILDFDVKSLTDSEKYRDNRKSSGEIGNELHVNYILEGSGQKIQNEIKLHIQLIDTETGNRIWSQSFQEKVENIFKLQEKVAVSIAHELKAKLSYEEKEKLKEIPTENTAAYSHYLRGMQYLHLMHSTQAAFNMYESRLNRSRAMRQFENAISLDSNYIEPYLQLGSIYINDMVYPDDITTLKYLDPGLTMIEKVIELTNSDKSKPEYGKALSIKGTYYLKKGMQKEAINTFKKYDLLQIENPAERYYSWSIRYRNLDDFYQSIENGLLYLKTKPVDEPPPIHFLKSLYDCFNNTGFTELAKKYAEEMLTLHGDSITYLCNLAESELYAGNFQKGLKLLELAYKMDSTNQGTFFYLTSTLVWNRKFSEAYNFLNKWIDNHNGYENVNLKNPNYGFIYLKNGENHEANEIFAKSIASYLNQIKYNTFSAQWFHTHLYLACVFAAQGQKEKALEYLKMIKNRETFSQYVILILEKWPMLDNIRQEPEFKGIFLDAHTKYRKEHQRIEELLTKSDEVRYF